MTIGVIESLTGIAAPYGTNNLQAIQMAANEINDQNRVTIKLVVEDDQTDPKKTVAAYQKLVNGGVDAIIGSTWDFTSNAIVPLANRDKTVLINSVMPESLQSMTKDGYVFSNGRSAVRATIPFEKFARREKISSVAIAVVNNSWGAVQLKSYKKLFESLGIRVIDSAESANFDANEWNTVVTRFKALTPDAVLLILNQNDIDLFVHRTKTLNLTSRIFSVETAAEALAASPSPKVFENLCMSFPMHDMDRQRSFAGRFREKYHTEPKSLSAAAFDTVGLLATAYAKSDGNKVVLHNALRLTELDGVAGRQRYNEDESFAVGEFSLTCVRNGKLHAE